MSVSPPVPHKVALLREALAAVLALKWPLARVRAPVPHKVALLREALAAVHALVWPLARVHVLVLHKAALLREALAAVLALVWPLACVRKLVGHKAALLREALAAVLALVWPQYSHLYGRSPVCVRSCLTRSLFLEKRFSQYSHSGCRWSAVCVRWWMSSCARDTHTRLRAGV